MRGFLKLICFGAAGAIGYRLGHKAVDTLENPYARAKIKNKFKKIKDAITEKGA